MRTVTLSPRQREVATLICADLTRGQVADRLGVSEGTVDHHLVMIRAKAGRESTTAAIVDLVRQGVL